MPLKTSGAFQFFGAWRASRFRLLRRTYYREAHMGYGVRAVGLAASRELPVQSVIRRPRNKGTAPNGVLFTAHVVRYGPWNSSGASEALTTDATSLSRAVQYPLSGRRLDVGHPSARTPRGMPY